MTNPKKRTTVRRKATSKQKLIMRSSKRKKERVMPLWVRNCLAICIILVFSAGFYRFCIRPYSYRWKPCYGQKGYGICMPCDYEVHGIDVSRYQGSINWEQVAYHQKNNFPLHFVFMKATEGGDHKDITFEQNFEQAGYYGFIRGAYHFFSPKTDPHKQADFFIRNVSLSAGDLPPVLDVETIGKSSAEDLQTAVKIWLDRIEKHYGVKPILYTSYKFKKRYLNDSMFNAYPYWIAHYYVDSVRYEGNWHFWQHTDVGSVPGIKEKVDLNVFNGSLEELQALTLPNVLP